MKRIGTYIQNMSLTQQLVSLVLISIFLFGFFLLSYIFSNIDHIAQDQMFESIHRSQDAVIENYYNFVSEENVFNNSDPTVVHYIIFTDDSRETLTNAATHISTDLLAEFIQKIKMQLTVTSDQISKLEQPNVAFTTTRVNNNVWIVSFMVTNTMNRFKLTLINEVVNIIIIMVGLIFLFLMAWVGYLIHSLKQIEFYITNYKKGENIELVINRKDEIGELATAIVSMNKELKRQEELKEEMVHNISHDLKTPIATIKSYGESIKDGIYPYDTLEASVDVIIEHASRLEKKVHSLLLLNRMEYMIQDTKPGKTDMKIVVEKSIRSVKVLKPEIKLITELTSCSYFGQEEPWRVVVENLLDNALRYAKTVVEIRLTKDELSVYNDGIKIPENRMQQLFKPYERGTGGQFGLGLSIVHRVITAYGYEIKIHNEDNGVTFIINPENPMKVTEILN
jgi:two-component system, OmpR family, sensor histidine kinase CssS